VEGVLAANILDVILRQAVLAEVLEELRSAEMSFLRAVGG